MRIDMHVHSKYSYDGVMCIESIVNKCKKKGLDGVAITDHNSFRYIDEIKSFGIKIITGMEIRTEYGDILTYFINEEIKSRKFIEVVKEVRKQDGICIVAHPFDVLRGASAWRNLKKILSYIDGIEIFNSRCVFNSSNIYAEKLCKNLKIPFVAGSDAHFSFEIGSAYIICKKNNIKNAILEMDVEYFGKLNTIFTHTLTKILKLKRTISF